MLKRITSWGALLAVGCIATIAQAHKTTEVTITVEKKTTEEATHTPFRGEKASVDVAILLDTSNSMDGLINQAKSQLWTIVQQFAKAKKNGQTPLLRVALFEYGNNGLPAAEGYIRQVVPLTDDLDKLSEALFSLSTNGGDEYCGQVIDQAITRLDWSQEPNSYKAIFIAGNEPFTQGSMNYQQACSRAIESGIVVNTIHCGRHGEGVRGKWEHGAKLAEGEFFNINQDRKIVHIECPQDKIILKLNAELNGTYLWFGEKKVRGYFRSNQRAQDTNAESLSEGIAVSRAVAKASPSYSNRARCLVDTYEQDKNILSKVKEEELPDSLRGLQADQREAHIKKMAEKRAEIRKQIADLAKERDAYLAKERMLRSAEGNDDTLGSAVVNAIGKQLSKSGFQVDNAK